VLDTQRVFRGNVSFKTWSVKESQDPDK